MTIPNDVRYRAVSRFRSIATFSCRFCCRYLFDSSRHIDTWLGVISLSVDDAWLELVDGIQQVGCSSQTFFPQLTTLLCIAHNTCPDYSHTAYFLSFNFEKSLPRKQQTHITLLLHIWTMQ